MANYFGEPEKYKNRKIHVGPKGGLYIKNKGKKEYIPRSHQGESNVSKYRKEGLSSGQFCGPSGGAARGSYPVNSSKRCSAALSYARFAPNPCGIARCVARKCPDNVGRSSELMRKCGIKR